MPQSVTTNHWLERFLGFISPHLFCSADKLREERKVSKVKADSFGTVVDTNNNELTESTIGLYVAEFINLNEARYLDKSHVERATAEWAYRFNVTRLHSGCGDIAPIEYESYTGKDTLAAHT